MHYFIILLSKVIKKGHLIASEIFTVLFLGLLQLFIRGGEQNDMVWIEDKELLVFTAVGKHTQGIEWSVDLNKET